MKNAPFRFSLALMGLMLLSACGFHPQGSYRLDDSLKQIYVSSFDEFSPLTRAIVLRLNLSDIEVLNSPQEGVPTLQLGQEKLEKRTLSLFENGQIAEYEMSYQLNSQLRLPDGQNLALDVQLHRDFQDNPLAALAKQRERDQLNDELRQMAADQIMRKLSTVQF